MKWNALILCAIIGLAIADPEPKKYKSDKKDKESSSLTDDERTFLREVESKFGIKSDVPTTEPPKEMNIEDAIKKASPGFPAVIAIEIVNDTDTKSKGKRTIDANLGYGYRTNNGYMYSYFGKPTQDKGKFMIYPYSQHDIPPARNNHYKDANAGYSNNAHTRHHGTVVDIQPSQAYELVPVKEENPYEYKRPVTELRNSYENVKGLETPPPPYPEQDAHAPSAAPPSSTLYTTYNGENFSGLQSQFPMVMSNYLVDPTQLLQNPQYQSAGLTQDLLRTHTPHLEQNQRVVPVLVLRIPSSYLKNPTAELYPNLPQNYPLSQHLNSVNLQGLVNQYFKKLGYPTAPQIMPFSNALHEETPAVAPQLPTPAALPQYEPQHYSNPYLSPSYTQADYSGVQYSAVQPVMAKYPSHGAQQQYYVQHSPQLQYEQPAQQYEYQYQYVPQSAAQSPRYYTQQQYQEQYQATPGSQEVQSSAEVQAALPVESGSSEQVYSQETGSQEQLTHSSLEYVPSSHLQPTQSYVSVQPDTASKTQYEYAPTNADAESKKTLAHTYGPSKVQIPTTYVPTSPTKHTYHSRYTHEHKQHPQKETVAIYGNQYQRPKYSVRVESGSDGSYGYQKPQAPVTETIVISENYPSKHHTHATVLPYRYKAEKQSSGGSSVQTVNYVTPLPYAANKFQSKYRVMVPQTVLKSDEKVSYVNSHSLPSQYVQVSQQAQDYSPEEEYAVNQQYSAAAAASSHSTSTYPKNYHSHKRMASNSKSDNKKEATKLHKKEPTTPKTVEKKSS